MCKVERTSRSKEAFFRLIFITVLALATVLISLMCSKKGESVPEEFRVLSVKKLYPRALEEAKRWNEGAYLNGADFWVAPLEDEHRLRASFEFGSEEEPKWLIIEFRETENGVEISSTSQGEYPVSDDKACVDLDVVKYDSLDAFMKIHEEGKRLFQEYPNMIYPIVLDLSCYSEQVTKWIALYDPVGSVSWRITMDAETNEILEVSIWGEE